MIETRYRQNLGKHFTEYLQDLLLNTTVAVIGVGGCGGFVVEHLVRMGIKKVIIFDGDRFEESNLNRQRFCDVWTIGYNKAVITKNELLDINPYVEVEIVQEYFRKEEHINKLLDEKIDYIFHCADNSKDTKELYDCLSILHITNRIPIIRLCLYMDMIAAMYLEPIHLDIYMDMKYNAIRQFEDNNAQIGCIMNTSHANAIAAGLAIEIFLASFRNPHMKSCCLAYHYDGMRTTLTDYIPYFDIEKKLS